MRIIVASVGRPRDLAAPIAGYEARAARYWPLESREVREERARGMSPAQIREREGARLLATVPDGSRIVVCDERGDHLTSEEFARWLGAERELAGPDLVFVIGGAFGLPESVRGSATRRLALAPWTLPHELARLVLAEQLYRAGTFLRGEPYHK